MASFDSVIENNQPKSNDHGGYSPDDPTQEELFSVKRSNEQELYTLVNVRIDYQRRGRHLYTMCLYDYVSSI